VSALVRRENYQVVGAFNRLQQVSDRLVRMVIVGIANLRALSEQSGLGRGQEVVVWPSCYEPATRKSKDE
jgi:hypothetical protein